MRVIISFSIVALLLSSCASFSGKKEELPKIERYPDPNLVEYCVEQEPLNNGEFGEIVRKYNELILLFHACSDKQRGLVDYIKKGKKQ